MMLAPIFLSFLPAAADDGIHDAKSLIAAIEAIQHPVEDFRCEFEGKFYFKGKALEDPSTKANVGPDGLEQTFDGVFTWKRGGETRSDSMHRLAASNQIRHKILIVRPSRNESEWHTRDMNAQLGKSVIDLPQKGSSHAPDCYGYIFLIDHLKREVANEANLVATVTEDQLDGRPVKVLNFTIKGLPDFVVERDWIDLRRGGHVLRREIYSRPDRSSKPVMGTRLDIRLVSFKLGDAEVWMPVSGDEVGYMAIDAQHRPYVSDAPTVISSIKIVDGSMEFNKHPGAEAFTIKYKPGTPISDNLRQLTYEFGQQKLPPRPTKAQVEAMLKAEVADAERQKTGLVVATPSQGFDWSSWLPWGMGAAVLASSAMLWVQRRR